MPNTTPFQPVETKTISATSTTASASFTAGTGVQAQQMIVSNVGSKEAFIRFGVGAQTALTTDFSVPAGAIMTLTKGLADTVAAICAGSDTTTLRLSAGNGS